MLANVTKFFSPPDGEELNNVSIDFLTDKLVNHGAEYWNAGAGQASLKFHLNERSFTELLIILCLDRFYFEYIDEQSVYYVVLQTMGISEGQIIYVGGDPLRVPMQCTVDRKTSVDLCAHFLKFGSRYEKINWVPRNQIEWEYSLE